MSGWIRLRTIFSNSLAVVHSSEIGRYDLPSVGSFPGLRRGIILEVFHCCGIMLVFITVVNSLANRLCALGPRCLR